MRKIFLSCFLALYLFYSFAQIPVINSFSPLSASPGSTVIIQGNNFGTNASSLAVWFGPVKGTISTATNTSINVTVPLGASEQPITLLKDTFATQASMAFQPIFNGGGAAFPADAFGAPDAQLPALNPYVFDFDGDGFPDYVAIKGSSQLGFYRNVGFPGRFQFLQDTAFFTNSKVLDMTVGDFNGDQKPDLALVMSSIYSYFFIYPNTSTPGNISFGSPYFYNIGTDPPGYIAAADVDGNGKTDVLVSYNSSGNAFTVIRNTTVSGIISFSPTKTTVNFGLGQVGSGNKLYIADLDKDGKQDVTVLSSYFRPLFIFRNTSTVGAVSFAPKINLETGRPFAITGGATYDLRITDMDGDQKPDLVFAHSDADSLSLFKNTSVSGTISFANRVVFKTRTFPQGMTTGDMNGDTKPDILFLVGDYSLCVVRNKSTTGNFLLDTAMIYRCGYPIQTINTKDLDLDGKPDILVSGTDYGGQNQHICNILRNKINGPVIKSVVPITADEGTPITVMGTRFTGVTRITLGDSAARSFTVINDSTLQLITGNGNTGDVLVETSGGKDRYPGFTYSLPIPSIDSVVPRSGIVGSNVRLFGKKFSTTINDNVVYFGDAKTSVLEATDTTLNVIVPAGGNTDPVRLFIKSRGLQAWAGHPFIVTRSNADTLLHVSDFGDTLQYSVNSYPTSIKSADLNEDGKTDVVSAIYFNTNRVSAFRNRTDTTVMMFDNAKDYATYSGSFGASSGNIVGAALADMNGDGKTDIVSVSAYPDSLSIFPNSSQNNEISFSKKKDFLTGSDAVDLTIADMDLDGIPDVACINASAGTLSVYKNISKTDSIMLKEKMDYPATVGSQDLLLQDLNGDKKPELIVTNYNSNNVSVYLNKSTCGNIAFSDKKTFATGNGPWYLCSVDVDGDNRPEVLTMNTGSKTVSVFRNISTSDSVSMEPKVDYSLPSSVMGFAVGEITGDGKPDLVVSTTQYPSSLSIFRNKSTIGQIQFATRFDMAKIAGPQQLCLADINNDGQLDIVAGTDNKKIAMLPNRMGMPAYGTMCRTTDTLTLFSDISGTTYQWQIDSGTGYVNILPATYFTGINTRTLKLWNVPSSWYGHQFRCVADSRNSMEYKLRFIRKWLGTSSNAWENPLNWACGQVPDANSDVIIYSGNVVVSSQVLIRSIYLRPAATLRINEGFGIQTTH